MKISLNWLKEFVDISVDANALARKLTDVGLAVESIQEVGGDTVFELDVTTNRPDCLNHVGVAREVSAIFARSLRVPQFLVRESGKPASEVFSISIADPELCGRYCGRYIAGVKIGESPEWLKDRLEVLGVRSINNVADITNYVMLEMGHPMHAFDADKLQGHQVIVRSARSGERLTTLDGADRALDPSILVIADSARPVALAGVMGGGETEISRHTVNVFLESACFRPMSIRKTARALGMSTEASYRFERGADIEMAPLACDRATALIQELAGGEVFRNLIDVYPAKAPLTHVQLRRQRIPAVLGAPVDDAIVETILRRLGFGCQATVEGWDIEVPSFRVDVFGEEDVLEEVARHHGFDKFPATLPAFRGFGAALPHDAKLRQLHGTLQALGYSEIYTYSFSDEAIERRFDPDIEPVRLRNPMSEEASILRTSLVPSLLRTLQRNLNRSIRNLQFYELSKVYSREGEKRTLILGACGDLRPASVHETAREFDFFDLKGDVQQALQPFDVIVDSTPENVPEYFHPGRFARVGHLARYGELHPDYADLFKFKHRVYIAEIEIDLLLSLPGVRRIRQIPRYPAIKRDFSILVSKGTQYASVERTISSAGLPEVVSIEPFDRMEFGPFPETKYSLSISVVYQSAERTLTDIEVESFDRKILEILEKRLGAQLRT